MGREHEIGPSSGSALPNLSRCPREGRIGECLKPPLNQTIPGKFIGARLRGVDAVFWPQKFADSIRSLVVEHVYPYNRGPFDRDDDFHFARENSEALHKNAALTQIPLEERTQTLYHWTDQFPSADYLEDADVVLTYGFVWTSTAKEFLWKRRQRLEIELPRGAKVQAFIDPLSHSRRINCNGELKPGSPYHHNDVVLQPSLFKLRERKLDWDLVDYVLQTCMAASESPKNIVSFERLQNESGWHIRCNDVGKAFKFLVHEQASLSGRAILDGSISVISQEVPGLLFVDASKVTKSPVLEWVGSSELAPVSRAATRVQPSPPHRSAS